MINELLFKLRSVIKPLLKPLIAAGLLISLTLGHPSESLAAGSGGRMGGGGFSSPRMAPTRTYQPAPSGGYGYGYGYGGGGYGLPFVLPLFFGGGGSLFTVLVFFAIAGFLIRTIRSSGVVGDGYTMDSPTTTVSVAKVQVGLLSSARYLQKELNQIAQTADTSSATGRAELLQESTLALLRHPEYWIYGATDSAQAALNSAEAKFNQWSLAERSKYRAETLSNMNNQLKQASQNALLGAGGELVHIDEDNGEYIIATIIVGVEGRLELPPVRDSQDLQTVVRQLGSIGSDRLLAVEVLWSPQAEGDVLTKDDIIAQYPNLTLV
ncbi:hypothetical protein C7H19_12755 [Aphanothece hegewaldii CCALA 016]|uniref:DUF1517 domain-containing protein n=1 Tax=Aphanothece hegewaldii CCALA 016 TaxID=2107694 RepID=A0A2T1LXB9_9CHRO|nr:DUF1517 domain-containing protein [Aphanothece hegewaldii]PSF36830.1 hypothetical protein C7H19_12755 [Aphanothece hegewaldii CCALA 016]